MEDDHRSQVEDLRQLKQDLDLFVESDSLPEIATTLDSLTSSLKAGVNEPVLLSLEPKTPVSRKPEASYRSLTHPVHIKTKVLTALADSGASMTFANHNLISDFQKLVPHLQRKTWHLGKVRGAFNSTYTPRWLVKLPITLGVGDNTITIHHWVALVDNFKFDLVLGTDFLKESKCHIDLEHDFVSYKSKGTRVNIPCSVLESTTSSPLPTYMPLRLVDTVAIDFATEMTRIPVRLDWRNPWRFSDLKVEVQSHPSCSQKHNVHCANGPLDLEKGRGYIQLSNWNPDPKHKRVTLHAGTIVAFAKARSDEEVYLSPDNIEEQLDLLEARGCYLVMKDGSLTYVEDKRNSHDRKNAPFDPTTFTITTNSKRKTEPDFPTNSRVKTRKVNHSERLFTRPLGPYIHPTRLKLFETTPEPTVPLTSEDPYPKTLDECFETLLSLQPDDSPSESFKPCNFPDEVDAHLRLMKLPNTLTDDQVNQISLMLSRNRAAFATNPSCPVATPFVKHKIDTGNSRPINAVPYRTGPKEREAIKKHVEEMLKDNIIQPSTSPWASPLVLVPKKDGSLRFCVDYRKLNKITTRDVYPLPRIDETLDATGGCMYYSTLDLASGYWQIEMDPNDKPKTAFISYEGLYEFNRMPFGLTNAPATFSRMMQAVLAGLLWKSCLVYLDDIIIFSKSFDEHMTHIEEVLQRLIKAGLTCKAKKCELFRDQVVYLGHTVGSKGVSADPAKIKAITQMPAPVNLSQLRSFYGCASYYRKLIKNFARIAHNLTQLLKKENEFSWTPDAQLAFDKIREILASDVVLAHPDFDLPFIIQTDASKEGIGAVLTQRDKNGRERIICCASRTLSRDESKWSIPHIEALGIIWGCETFRPYVIGQHFTVETDHGSLRWLMENTQPGRLSRWALRLQEFDFEIKHRAGTSNGNADGFSRLPIPMDSHIESPSLENFDKLYSHNSDQPDVPLFVATRSRSALEAPEFGYAYHGRKDLIKAQREDNKLQEYIEFIETNTLPTYDPPVTSFWTETQVQEYQTKRQARFKSKAKYYTLHDGLLYYKFSRSPDIKDRLSNERPKVQETNLPEHWRIVVPTSMRTDIMQAMHNSALSAHVGTFKTYERIASSFYWDGMRHEISRWISGCLLCSMKKSSPTTAAKQGYLQPILTGRPFQIVSVDILGPLPKTTEGHNNILVMVDHFTNWCELIPVKSVTSKATVETISDQWISRYGCPEAILTDQGTNFESGLFYHVCKRFGIKKLRTTAYHPQTNSKVERLNRFIAAGLSMYVNRAQNDWHKHLQPVAFAYRSSVIENLNETPYFMLFGRDSRLPLDVLYGKAQAVKEDVNTFKFIRGQTLRAHWKKINSIRKQMAERNISYYNSHQSTPHDYPLESLAIVYTPYIDPHKTNKLDEFGEVILTSRGRPQKTTSSRTEKLTLLWRGPYRIIGKLSDLVYKVQHLVQGTVMNCHIQRMRPYKPYMTENFKEVIDTDGEHMRYYEEDHRRDLVQPVTLTPEEINLIW